MPSFDEALAQIRGGQQTAERETFDSVLKKIRTHGYKPPEPAAPPNPVIPPKPPRLVDVAAGPAAAGVMDLAKRMLPKLPTSAGEAVNAAAAPLKKPAQEIQKLGIDKRADALATGLWHGLIGVNAKTAGGAIRGIGALADRQDFEEIGGKVSQFGKDALEAFAPRVGSIRDVRTPGDFADYAAASLGSGVGTSVPSAIMGVVAALGTANPVFGFAVGAAGPSYFQSFGEVYDSALDDLGIAERLQRGDISRKKVAQVAMIAAAPMAALDVISLEKSLGKALFAKAKDNLVKRMIASAKVGAVMEGGTELWQNNISQWAQDYLGSNKGIKDRFFEAVDNMLGGMLSGGAMGAGGAAAARPAGLGGPGGPSGPGPGGPAGPTAPPAGVRGGPGGPAARADFQAALLKIREEMAQKEAAAAPEAEKTAQVEETAPPGTAERAPTPAPVDFDTALAEIRGERTETPVLEVAEEVLKEAETPGLQQVTASEGASGEEQPTAAVLEVGPAASGESVPGQQPQPTGESLPGQEGTDRGKKESLRLFPLADSVSSDNPSLTDKPAFVKLLDDGRSVVEKHAAARNEPPSPEFTQKLFKEMHDEVNGGIGDMPTRIKRMEAAKAKNPDIEAEWIKMVGAYYGATVPGYFDAMTRREAKAGAPAAEPKPVDFDTALKEIRGETIDNPDAGATIEAEATDERPGEGTERGPGSETPSGGAGSPVGREGESERDQPGGDRERPAGPRTERERDPLDAERDSGAEREGSEGTDQEVTPPTVDRAAAKAAKPTAKNYSITPEDQLGLGGPKQKYKKNVRAIRLLKQIEAENRQATPAEQQELVKYVGWGSLPNVFGNRWDHPDWEKEQDEVREVMDEDEWNAAAKSTLNAHYTSPPVISFMWDAVRKMGLTQGKVLEPSMGVGHFIGLRPAGSQYGFTGVELDSLTGRLAKQLYQRSDIRVQGFQDLTAAKNFYDLAISNVPFGDYKVFDKAYKELGIPRGLSIHNFFFAKSLALVRPGGVVAFITSKYTMDEQDSSFRQYISDRADLIAAYRLPSTAFKGNAGTEVLTDVIFLKKRAEGEAAAGPQWGNIVDTKVEGGTYAMNEYYKANPDNVLGTLVKQGGHYMKDIIVKLDGEIQERLTKALESVPADVVQDRADMLEEAKLEQVNDQNSLFLYTHVVKDGKIYQKVSEQLLEERQLGAQAGRMKGIIGIRDALLETVQAQFQEKSEAEVKTAQKALNKAYDTFVKKYGNLNDDANADILEADPYGARLLNLEVEEGKGYKKADIFSEKTIRTGVQDEKASTPKDAMTLSLSKYGRVNPKYMAKILKQDVAKVTESLVADDLIYQNPAGQQWETKEEYLSGNVKAKLKEAQAAVQLDPSYKRNVEALEAVQPEDVPYDRITAQIGTPWIEPHDMERFVNETLDFNWRGVKISHNELLGEWVFGGKPGYSATNEEVLGTDDMDAIEIIQRIANARPIKVTRKDGEGKTYVDQEATALAQDKAEQIKQKFDEWFWPNAERRNKYVRLYNDKMNVFAERKYDGSHLTFPGYSGIYDVRKSQIDAIWRVIQSKTTLLAHSVGAGKTLIMIASAMEMKRMGLINKPVFVVPTSTLPSWRREFNKFYPGANILMATNKNFSADKRKQFVSMMSNGNWDAVVLGLDANKLLPVSTETYEKYVRERIGEIQSAIDEMDEGFGDKTVKKRTVKQLQKQIEKLEEKLKERVEGSKKDAGIYFEETGADAIFVDEADEFKNLAYQSRQTDIRGMGKRDGNIKTDDLMMKLRVVQERGGRVVYATATPMANSVVEVYNMMKYLQPDVLHSMGVHNFDDWAKAFGNIQRDLEMDAAGRFKYISRFSRFSNLQTLLRTIRQTWDIKTRAMLEAEGVIKRGRDTPMIAGGKMQAIETPAIPEAQAFFKTLSQRATQLKRAEKGGDNMFLILNDGKKATLDMRLIDENLPANPDSKLEVGIRDIIDHYQQYKNGETMVVFYDQFKKDPTAKFNPPLYIQKKLEEAGIPAKEIAHFSDYKKDTERADLFDKFNKGEVRIIIGSRQAMGVGVNIQKKLRYVLHLDLPYTARGIEQGNGRIDRPGNENTPLGRDVSIRIMVAKGSFDTFMYQMLEAKAKSFDDLLSGKLKADQFEEEVNEYELFKVIAADNPLVREKAKVDENLRKLRALRSGYEQQRTRAEDELLKIPKEIERLEKQKETADKDIEERAPKPEKDVFSIEIDNKTYDDKEKAHTALKALSEEIIKSGQGERNVGAYRGWQVYIKSSHGMTGKTEHIVLEKNGRYDAGLTETPVGTFVSVDSAIYTGPEERSKYAEKRIKELTDKQTALEGVAGKKFEKEADFKKLLDRQREIEKELRGAFEGKSATDVSDESESEGGGRSGGGMASIPSLLPSSKPEPPADGSETAEPQMERSEDHPILEMPEIVELAQSLAKGRYPSVRRILRMRNAWGVFYPGFGGSIELLADIFKTPGRAEKVLAHEVGHFIDFLPDELQERGNILGRMASLKKFMKGWYEFSFKAKEIREELKKMTMLWNPFDEGANTRYTKYRYSGVELYADALSVLFNSPGLLKKTAPRFYKGFFRYLSRKPEVLRIYNEIVDAVESGAVVERRLARTDEMYERGEEAFKKKVEDGKRSTGTLWDSLQELFVEKAGIDRAVAKATKAGRMVSPEDNPVYAKEEVRYSDAESYAYVQSVERIYNELKAAGVSWDDFSTVLMDERVMGDRAAMANPQGRTAKSVVSEVDAIEKKLGPEKWKALRKAAEQFRDGREYIIQRVEQEEFVSEELLKKMKENRTYVTFDVIQKDVSARHGAGISSHIFKQFGTLKEVHNVANATILKDIAILKAINRKVYARQTVEFLRENFPESIRPAKERWNGKHMEALEPTDPTLGMIAYPHNGKVEAFWVDKAIADDFQYDAAYTSKVIKLWDALNNFFRDVFVSLRPGFQAFNSVRDFWATATNVRGMGFFKTMVGYYKALGSAKGYAFGVTDDIVQEMLIRKVLITPNHRWGESSTDNQFEEIVNKYSDSPENLDGALLSKIKGIITWVRRVGNMIETLPKVAGFKHLKKHQAEYGLSDREIDHMVRFQAGSPPFLLGGRWKRPMGAIFLFSNPFVQGWRRSIEAAKARPAEIGWNVAKYNMLPRMVMVLGAMGLLGDWLRDLLRGVSEYNKTNYLVIPLGKDSEDNTVALRIPQDDTGRVLSGLLWKLTAPLRKERLDFKDLQDLSSYTLGQLPSLTPVIGASVDLMNYLSNINPYDRFRSKNVVNDRVFEAGGMRSHIAMAKHLANSLGAGIAYRFNTQDIEGVKTELQRIIGAPILGDILGRFIIVSKYGMTEELREVGQKARSEKADKGLDELDAMIQNINAADNPGPKEAAFLYKRMVKEGMLRRALGHQSFGDFLKTYTRLVEKKTSDPAMNALIYAQSNEEKAAILEHMEKTMSKEDYEKVRNAALAEGFLGLTGLALSKAKGDEDGGR